jgi:prepilin-type N-terminal cleavage/methylation domain-containing protein
MKYKISKGFTLVELAIVLVIIGLLVGGVLAGQELIKQAKINKVVSEIDEIVLARETFHLKYRVYPGTAESRKIARTFPPCTFELQDVPQSGDPLDTNPSWCTWQQLAVSGLYEPIGPKKDFSSPGSPPRDVNFINGDAYNFAIWPLDITLIVVFGEGISGRQQLFLSDPKSRSQWTIFSPATMIYIENKFDDGRPFTGAITSGQPFETSECFTNPVWNTNNFNWASSGSEYLHNDKVQCGFIYNF